MRTKGRAVINMNYTFGKAMGIVSSTLDSVQPQQRLRRAADQPHAHLQRRLLVQLRAIWSRNKFAGGFVNGWQVSGIMQIQSGANLTGQRGQNFGLSLNSARSRAPPITSAHVAAGTPNIS